MPERKCRPILADSTSGFVLRKYRRAGIGTIAARALFARFPGRWQVRQLAMNAAATAFWRRAILVSFDERRGDTVITNGGLVAKVTKVVDDDQIEVEISDGVRVRQMRSMVTEVRAKGEPVKDETAS